MIVKHGGGQGERKNDGLVFDIKHRLKVDVSA